MKTIFFFFLIPFLVMTNREDLLRQLEADIEKVDKILTRYPNLRPKYAAQIDRMEIMRARVLQEKTLSGGDAPQDEDENPIKKFVQKVLSWLNGQKSAILALGNSEYKDQLVNTDELDFSNILGDSQLAIQITKKLNEATKTGGPVKFKTVEMICDALTKALNAIDENFLKEHYKQYSAKDGFFWVFVGDNTIANMLAAAARRAQEEARRAESEKQGLYKEYETALAAWSKECQAIKADTAKEDKFISKKLLENRKHVIFNRSIEDEANFLAYRLVDMLMEKIPEDDKPGLNKLTLNDALDLMKSSVGELAGKYSIKCSKELFDLYAEHYLNVFTGYGLIRGWLESSVPMQEGQFKEDLLAWIKQAETAVSNSYSPTSNTRFDKKNCCANWRPRSVTEP